LGTLAEELCLDKVRVKSINCTVPRPVPEEYDRYLVSLDGGYVRSYENGESAASVSMLLQCEMTCAGRTLVRDVSNNETEGCNLIWGRSIDQWIVVSDSSLVIKPIRATYQRKAPQLERPAGTLEAQICDIKFVYVVRVLKAVADYVAGTTLRTDSDYQVPEDE
jgi:hypothetical protein